MLETYYDVNKFKTDPLQSSYCTVMYRQTVSQVVIKSPIHSYLLQHNYPSFF